MNKIPYELIFDQIKNLEQYLKCEQCTEIFKDPTIIGRCGHTFCHNCILNHESNQCPTCKVPIERKDVHEDKQLRGLILLVQELKLILDEKPTLENQTPNTPLPESSETPNDQSNNISAKSPVKSVAKIRRMRKRPKCFDTECFTSPRVCLTPMKLSETNLTVNSPTIKRKTPLTSPVSSKLKRSPFRYSAFSASKRALHKSPNTVGSPLTINLEKRNCKGETPLHIAVIKGDVDRVKMLLNKNANPNVKDNAGWTPLHEASQNDFLEIIKLLVAHGASVNVPGPDNIMPLHDALINGNIEIAKFLVSVKADVNARTSKDLSALDLCKDEELKMALQNINTELSETMEAIKKIKSPPEKLKLRLIYTSLDEEQIMSLQNCAKEILNATITDHFTISVSHVVTTMDKKKRCKRTVKILQGILCGKWIVSNDWIEACIKQKKPVSEEMYEAKGTIQQPILGGPTRARRNAEEQKPSLFHGCFFYLNGLFNPPCPSKEIVSHLIQLGGGKLLAREPKAETVKLEKFTPPYHAKGGPVSKFSHFILFQDKLPKEMEVPSDHICTVNFLWLVNSICSFTLLDPNSIN